MKKIKKFSVVVLVAAALLISNIVPVNFNNIDSAYVSKAAMDGDSVEREFDAYSARFGAALNMQMERYLADDTSGGEHAIVETDFTKAGMKSTVRFRVSSSSEFPLGKDVEDAGDLVLRWLDQAIATYPSLCTLLVNCSYTSTVDLSNNHFLQDITVYSPIGAGEIRSTTDSYNRALASLTAVPGQGNALTGAEKALLVHDRLAALSDYGDMNKNSHHTAQAVLLEKKGVCESYAYCFNHAMKRLGVNSISLRSETHAWNAVRLDNKWYFVDVTWDDPQGDVPISYVGHKFFLVAPSAFTDSHTLTPLYTKAYGKILQQMGNAYDSYFPKVKQNYETPTGPFSSEITRPLYYLDGKWYYSNRIGVYTWDGKGSEARPVTDILSGYSEVCCAVHDGILYYSNPEGVFRYRGNNEDIRLVEGNITAMTLREGVLSYKIKDASGTEKEGSYLLTAPLVTPEPIRTAPPVQSETPIDRPYPTPSQTVPVGTSSPLPTQTPPAEPSASPTVKAPGRTTIRSAQNVAAAKAKIKVKAVSGADGYQVSCSLKKNFKKAKKASSAGTTITVKKLKKKKVYFVRARAYALDNGKKRYGAWSKTIKIKIKK